MLCIAAVLYNCFVIQIYEETSLDFPYMLKGSNILVTGGDEFDALEFPADNSLVLILIGPVGPYGSRWSRADR